MTGDQINEMVTENPKEEVKAADDDMKFMDLNIQCMVYQGLWPSTKDTPSWQRWLRYFYPRFLILTSIYNIFVTHALDVYYSWGKKLFVIENIILICIYIMLVVQVGTFVFQVDHVQKLVQDLERLYRPRQYFDSYHKAYLQDSQLFCHKISTTVPVLINSLLVIFVVTTLFHLIPQRMLYFRGWYPFDALNTPEYELMLLYSITIIFLVINSLGIGDVFFVVVLVLALRQFKCLSYKLEHIRKFARTRAFEHRRKTHWSKAHPLGSCVSHTIFSRAYVQEALKFGPYRDKLSNLALLKPLHEKAFGFRRGLETSVKIERFRVREGRKTKALSFESLGRIKIRQEHRLGGSHLRERTDEEMARLLVDCVQHHQDLLNLLTKLTEVFNPILIYQFICNLAGTGLLASYASQQSTSLNSKTLGMMELLFVCICKLFLFCLLANQISDESSYVRDALYRCDWFEASEEFKKLMRITMSRANKPTVIKAFGFVPLSLEVFGAVTKTAYSYFTILDKAKASPPHHRPPT